MSGLALPVWPATVKAACRLRRRAEGVSAACESVAFRRRSRRVSSLSAMPLLPGSASEGAGKQLCLVEAAPALLGCEQGHGDDGHLHGDAGLCGNLGGHERAERPSRREGRLCT